MPTERTGTGRSTTFFDDPPEITLAGVGTNHYFDSPDGVGTAVAPANHGRLRYNNTTKTWQQSIDGGAYSDIASSSGTVGGTGTPGTIAIWASSTNIGDSSIVETADDVTVTKSFNGHSQLIMLNPDSGSSALPLHVAINDVGAACYIGIASSTFSDGGFIPSNYGIVASSSDSDGLVLFAGFGSKPLKITASNFALDPSTGTIQGKDQNSVCIFNNYSVYTGTMDFVVSNGNAYHWRNSAPTTMMTLTGTGDLTPSGNIISSGGDIQVTAGHEIASNRFSVLTGGATMVFVTIGGKYTFDGALEPTVDDSFDLGAALKRWHTLYSQTLNTGDLNMSDLRKGSSWTLREAKEDDEDVDLLYFINQRTKRKFGVDMVKLERLLQAA